MVIWQGRWSIILAILVAAIFVFAYVTFVRGPVDEATVFFLAPDYQLTDGKALRQSDYWPPFRKQSIAKELVRKYDLASPDVDRAISQLLDSIGPRPIVFDNIRTDHFGRNDNEKTDHPEPQFLYPRVN